MIKAVAVPWVMPRREETPADDAVVAEVLSGRTDAFETLVSRYEGLVFSLVRRHVPAADVEDTAQEAFIKAYTSLPTYQGRGSGFKSWLTSITVRTCYNYWRRAYRSKEKPMSHLTLEHEKWLDSVLTESSVQTLREQGATRQAQELLEAGLSQLSAEDRLVLELVYLEGHSGREAAELLGWSTTNVKVRCFRARRKLEAFLLKTKRSES